MLIAVHQMRSGTDPVINSQTMARAIRESSSAGAVMYFAPEMSLLVDRDRVRAVDSIFSEAETQSLDLIRTAAAEHSIWVHLGSIPIRTEVDSRRLANRSIVIDSNGAIRARYDKIHLFDVALTTGESWRESSVYDSGSSAVIVGSPLGALGLTICYDLRFPDLFSALAQSGVDVLAVPAAFTVPTGQAHWEVLLRARAIEAQAFVIAAAQSGLHEDGRSTYGHSMVIDPWGEVLLDMGEGEGLGYAELDFNRITEVRSQIPAIANHREIGTVVKIFDSMPEKP